ncbi:uncharacterized protein LOC126779543 [Nymphalis io]|uniref:uncharacterized protein LOC126779543 n=1 Tax=Inachis io TaxID=171585 RepID=UPI002168D68C|nr:uncharacterized protein LOC126779543 [Nymphalis io]
MSILFSKQNIQHDFKNTGIFKMDIEDTSNDVVAINSDDDDEEASNSDKPIINLFKRLITNNSKQSTVLTNTQIIDILNKEFNVNISELHELEGDIYLTIMKKYLKDWPQWDEFDRVITGLKGQNKEAEMERIFQAKYVNLKNYLKVMLDSAQGLAKATVKKATDNKIVSTKESNKDITNSTVVLEIHSSRNQLNQLFFRQPHSKLNNTLFNALFSLPTQIQLKMLPLEAILNWWGVSISLLNDTNIRAYKRETKHELSHVLVNKIITSRLNPSKVLDQNIQIANYHSNASKMNTSVYINVIDKISAKSPEFSDIYDFIKKDLKLLPQMVYSRATYKRYTNKYSYIRYLNKNTYNNANNVNEEFKQFDLQLEEMVSPMYTIFLGQFNESNPFLVVECEPCSIKFTGQYLINDLKNHFNEQHQNEPDWKCTNCKKKISMTALAQNWWTHRC